MILRTLKLTNFRNLNGIFTISNGLNLIIGKNGIGKTNFIEAVSFLAYGKSFRTNQEVNVIKKSLLDVNSNVYARIEGTFIDSIGGEELRDVFLEKANANDRIRKTIKVNSKKTIINKLLRNFYIVIFSPNTIDLVIGSPFDRREDLNNFLSIYDYKYFNEINEYKKIVQNRNKVLEKLNERKGTTSELVYWNDKLSDLGSKIIYKRVTILKYINKILLSIAPDLFNLNIEDAQIIYNSKFVESDYSLKDIYSKLKSKVDMNFEKEIYARRTLYGPHREDYSFFINSKDLKEMGSRGQQRLCVFLYKIAQWKLLKRKVNTIPLLIFDDLFSELDGKVKKNLIHFFKTFNSQIIITNTSKKEFNEFIISGAKIIKL